MAFVPSGAFVQGVLYHTSYRQMKVRSAYPFQGTSCDQSIANPDLTRARTIRFPCEQTPTEPLPARRARSVDHADRFRVQYEQSSG